MISFILSLNNSIIFFISNNEKNEEIEIENNNIIKDENTINLSSANNDDTILN